MKIITFYLPQFHTIPENDKWWGKGFTEWTNVRNAKKLFKGHDQPRVPYNNNYYCLTNTETLEWQAKVAKWYGIYGFCYYHYWFEGDLLLEKPAELMLNDKFVDIPFCFSWANHQWDNNWAGKSLKIVKQQTYGGKEDWEKHFNYFLKFFQDERYIKEDGKPLLVIYDPGSIPNCKRMLEYWNQSAIKAGFNGMKFAFQIAKTPVIEKRLYKYFDYGIEYQPGRAMNEYASVHAKDMNYRINRFIRGIRYKMHIPKLMVYKYTDLWEIIINQKPKSEKSIPGAFVDWDNTPRKKRRGAVCTGVSAEEFEHYMKIQIERAKNIYHKDKIFLFAWNEWAEGGYLEPDRKKGYNMLRAIKKSLLTNKSSEK